MTRDEILSDLYLRLHTADEARDLIDGIVWREINAHVTAEREACATICDEEANRMEEGAQRAIEDGEHDEVSAIRSTAWKLCVAASRIRKRGEK